MSGMISMTCCCCWNHLLAPFRKRIGNCFVTLVIASPQFMVVRVSFHLTQTKQLRCLTVCYRKSPLFTMFNHLLNCIPSCSEKLWHSVFVSQYWFDRLFQEPKFVVPTIYKAYVSGLNFREYPDKIWPYMILTYIHFRILKFPLISYLELGKSPFSLGKSPFLPGKSTILDPAGWIWKPSIPGHQ